MKIGKVLVALGILLGAAGGTAWASGAIGSIVGDVGTINGCYQQQNGQLRVVAAGEACRDSELALSWAQKGPAGEPGARGEQGPQGERGRDGASGPQGLKGDKGDAGAPGATGDQGPQGVQGPRGSPGVTGATGAPGAVGSQGPKGDKGDRGEPGTTGAPRAWSAVGYGAIGKDPSTIVALSLPAGDYVISGIVPISSGSSNAVACHVPHSFGTVAPVAFLTQVNGFTVGRLTFSGVLSSQVPTAVTVRCDEVEPQGTAGSNSASASDARLVAIEVMLQP